MTDEPLTTAERELLGEAQAELAARIIASHLEGRLDHDARPVYLISQDGRLVPASSIDMIGAPVHGSCDVWCIGGRITVPIDEAVIHNYLSAHCRIIGQESAP